MTAHPADLATEIGQRVRELRHAGGLSLSVLAHRAGIGKATLSGIEDGTRRNPTIETLYAIAGQLNVPLAAILPEPQQRREAIHGTAVSATLLETFSDQTSITELYRLHIRPDREQTSPAHPPGTVEYLTVFSGTARVGTKDEPIIVPPGGHASWHANIPHVYATVGDTEVNASLVIRSPREKA